ncbi:MAG TPA: hotdog domain-containing protein [Acidimicrobiia bacterium]|nr:hotdog domain-containing protein [Acidimicrobiia bacterium]
MTIHALENGSWGLETNCFVCEPANTGGLRVPFFHDDETDVVFADFTLDTTFSGAPNYVHGGVTLALLDECAAWATIAISQQFAVTHHLATTFDRPIKINTAYRVEARVGERVDDRIHTTAEIRDVARQKVRARSTAEFVVLGRAQLIDAMGSDQTIPSPTARLEGNAGA